MKRLPLIVLALLVLGSAGFGLAQLDEVQKLRQNVVVWEKERAELQKRIWDLQKKNNELANRRAPGSRPTTAMTEGDGPPPEDGPRDGNGGPLPFRLAGRNDGGRFGAMMASPEVQKLMALQQKAGLDGRYSSLFKQLQLSPADLEKFKSLLVEKQSAVMDVMAAARAEGLTGRENRDEIRQLVQQAQTDVDNNIRTTLGDAAYAQYQGYEATQPERTVVSQLEQRLSYSATPLTDAQSQQLVQTLATTAAANGNTTRNNGGQGVVVSFGGATAAFGGGGGTQITTDAITQAQSYLSAQQVAALQALQQEQQASAALRQQLRANQGGTASTTSTTTTPRVSTTPVR